MMLAMQLFATLLYVSFVLPAVSLHATNLIRASIADDGIAEISTVSSQANDCNDIWSAKKCRQRKKRGKCDKNWVKNKCQKTCEVCKEANIKCDSFTCSGDMPLNKGSGVECAGGLCDAKQCCKANPKCDSFTCVGHMPVNKGSEVECVGGLCDAKQCCEANPTCDSFICSGDMPVNKGSEMECKGGLCDAEVCCKESEGQLRAKISELMAEIERLKASSEEAPEMGHHEATPSEEHWTHWRCQTDCPKKVYWHDVHRTVLMPKPIEGLECPMMNVANSPSEPCPCEPAACQKTWSCFDAHYNASAKEAKAACDSVRAGTASLDEERCCKHVLRLCKVWQPGCYHNITNVPQQWFPLTTSSSAGGIIGPVDIMGSQRKLVAWDGPESTLTNMGSGGALEMNQSSHRGEAAGNSGGANMPLRLRQGTSIGTNVGTLAEISLDSSVLAKCGD